MRTAKRNASCLTLLLFLAGCQADVGAHGSGLDVGDAHRSQDTSSDIGDLDATQPDTTHPDAAEPDAAPKPPRCTVSEDAIQCTRNTKVFESPVGFYERREVHWQVPTGTPPAEGWPAAILFQGSFYSSERYWEGESNDPMGLIHRVRTIDKLLEAGFAVITPEAHFAGSTYWDTNIAPWATSWTTAPDHEFMLDIFAAIDAGDFGEVDADRLYAGGISSGGYMTSRMAVAYPGRFRALAVLSASYCWCAGYSCYVPSDLPDDHPPTLFVHGRLDATVPVWTMTPYEEGLSDQGTATRLLIDDNAGHHWIEEAPAAILDWFQSH